MALIRSLVVRAFMAALLVPVWAGAANLTVNSAADDGTGVCSATRCTLRDAVLSSASGDTIYFSLPADNTITLTNGQLLIDKNLTINGPGSSLLTVQRSTASGTPQFRIFDIAANVTAVMSGLTIANGSLANTRGAGIRNGGRLVLTATTVTGNSTPLSGGGGIDNTGQLLTLFDSTIFGNRANSGGGINSSAGGVTLVRSTLAGNYGDFGGGANVTGGQFIMDTATMSGNSAFDGGGINNSGGMVTITNSTISGNSAADGGGGIFNNVGSVTARTTIIALNTAPTGPDFAKAFASGGYNLIGSDKDATISRTTGDQIGSAAAPIDPRLGPLQDNGGKTPTQALLPGSPAIDKGIAGGSLTDQRGVERKVDSPIIANASEGTDIGAYEVQPDALVGCSEINLVVNNNGDGTAGSLRSVIANACSGSTIGFAPNVNGTISLTAGELAINKNLTINGPGPRTLTISGSNASRILNVAAGIRAVVSGLTIADGSSTGSGGGIFNAGTLILQSCAVLNNSGGSGGGAVNSGTLRVEGCTFAGNRSTGFGGALRNTASLVVINSTFDDNTAFSSGAIASFVNVAPEARLDVANATISGNRASDPSAGIGGGIFNGQLSSTTVQNSIIANNSAAVGPDVGGTLASIGFNLIGNGSGATLSGVRASDQIGTAGSPINPLLGPLQDNGGSTSTMALLPGSRALNAGNSFGFATDQRGFLRPIGAPAVTGGDGGDIGAIEVQGPEVVEFYNPSLDHYFITWVADEIAKLDEGTQIRGWGRTGSTLKTYVTAQPGTSPVCRFYIPPELGDSHFFGRGMAECDATGLGNPSFILEEAAFMQMYLPSLGVCPANTTKVYRVFSNRPDANHRYVTDPALRDEMVAMGWLAEGDGPDLVVMCAPL